VDVEVSELEKDDTVAVTSWNGIRTAVYAEVEKDL
jgi:hypothetical protein